MNNFCYDKYNIDLGITSMQISRALIFFSLLLSTAECAASICRPTKSVVCVASVCTQIQKPDESWIEVNGSGVARCFSNGCDRYDAVRETSGVYQVLTIPKSGYILKIDDELNFTEVATLGLRVLIKTGICK
jgi:hypothetical protein